MLSVPWEPESVVDPSRYVSRSHPCARHAHQAESWISSETTTRRLVITARSVGKDPAVPARCRRTPQDRSGFLHDSPRKLAAVSGQASQSLNVYNVDVATPQFHCPRVLQPGERSGDRLSFDPDHRPELAMRVVSRYLEVVVGAHHTLAFDEREDEAGQACRHIFEGDVFQTRFVPAQPVAEYVRYLHAHLRLFQHDLLQMFTADDRDLRRFHGLRVHPPKLLSS